MVSIFEMPTFYIEHFVGYRQVSSFCASPLSFSVIRKRCLWLF